MRKIKDLSLIEKLIEIVGIILWIFYLFLIISTFSDLPADIPTHYGANGEADSFGPKRSILMLPIFGAVLYVFLTVASFNPQKYYSTSFITDENSEKQYAFASKLFRILKIIILLVFIYIDYQTIQIALNNTHDLGNWFYIFASITIFAPIAYFSIKSLKREK